MTVQNAETPDPDVDAKWEWTKDFGRVVGKDDEIWRKYVQVATAYDNNVIGTVNHIMDIHLVFSAMFSAVVTTMIVQSDSGLQPRDQSEYLIKRLGKVFYDQFNLALQILQPPSGGPPFPYIPPDDYSVNISLLLWYISLDLALLVAGGAVCMKIWLFEHQRRRTTHQVPYYRAIQHQQSFASLQKWFILEFGDLLGCILLFDLIPFFYGWFTTVVGIFVPESPYRTPISNMLQQLPMIFLRYLTTRHDYKRHASVILVLVAGIGTAVISGIILSNDWDIVRYAAILGCPIFLSVPLGLRDGLKMGRISYFVPLMSLFLFLLFLALLLLLALPVFEYSNQTLLYNFRLYAPFGLLIPFILTIIVLSHRFSTVRSRRNFPALALIVCCCGMVVTMTLKESQLLLQVTIAWVSTVILLIASLQHETDVEEDTREAEALGWLITHASDLRILRSALVCIPSVANTPLRRKIIAEQSHATLSLLINGALHVPHQSCPAISEVMNEESHSDHYYGQDFCDDRESILAFYLTCLAEVLGTTVSGKGQRTELPKSLPQRASILRQGWLRSNWYRLLTIPPSTRAIVREYRFPHDWYPPAWPSLSPPHSLQVDLDILSEHHNSYIRAISRAAKLQLYPPTTLLGHITEWPLLEDSGVLPGDFLRQHVMLVELRMATARAIELWRHSEPSSIRYLSRYSMISLNFWTSVQLWKTEELWCDDTFPDPSIVRYLQKSCVIALNLWESVELQQSEEFLQTTLLLAYVVTERSPKALFVASLGDATPMKAARCIMALKRRYDGDHQFGHDQSDGDHQLSIMLAQALLSAITHYLGINLRAPAEIKRRAQIERANVVDENSNVTGLQYLEHAVLQMASQEWPSQLIDLLILCLNSLFKIGDILDIAFHPLDPSYNVVPLMCRLKSQISVSKLDSDKGDALKVACRILNKVTSDSVAWSLALDDPKALPDTIAAMAQSTSTVCRSAGLFALLNTHIFHPSAVAVQVERRTDDSKPTADQETELLRVDIATSPGSSLARLYNTVTSHPSPLLHAISVSINPLDIGLIRTSLNITSLLVDSPRLKHYVSDFIHRGGYAEALASVASYDDTRLLPTSIRRSAIFLYARLWELADEWKSEDGVIADRVDPGKFIEDIAKGVNLVLDRRDSIELDCISIWLERLQEIRKTSQPTETAGEMQLIDALRRAVPFSSFGKPVEARRAALSLQLIQQWEQIEGSTSRNSLRDSLQYQTQSVS
ncbi:hypothetical protein FRC02_009967 [Tulasnella sp. 418]|nr:hypothetical protein FRC02_009967 [Tulasnella sp. 418]